MNLGLETLPLYVLWLAYGMFWWQIEQCILPRGTHQGGELLSLIPFLNGNARSDFFLSLIFSHQVSKAIQ